MANRVAVVGVGQTYHKSQRPDVTQMEMVNEAVRPALADAQLHMKDIDAVFVGNMETFEGIYLPDHMMADFSGATPSKLQTDFRQLGRLARPGLATHNDDLVLTDGSGDLLAFFNNRQRWRIVRRWRRRAALSDALDGVLDCLPQATETAVDGLTLSTASLQ